MLSPKTEKILIIGGVSLIVGAGFGFATEVLLPSKTPAKTISCCAAFTVATSLTICETVKLMTQAWRSLSQSQIAEELTKNIQHDDLRRPPASTTLSQAPIIAYHS